MSSHHLKRLAMPRSWPLPRKTSVWVTRPMPGAHSLEHCMPVSLVIRDVLGLKNRPAMLQGVGIKDSTRNRRLHHETGFMFPTNKKEDIAVNRI